MYPRYIHVVSYTTRYLSKKCYGIFALEEEVMSEYDKQPGNANNPLAIIELRETVRQHLEALTTEQNINPLRHLFWYVFEYERVNATLPRTNWRDKKVVDFLADDPVLLASGGTNRDFPIYYARLNTNRLLAGQERA